MLTIRCATCKTKLWKYDKIGHGEVLRCHKVSIQWHQAQQIERWRLYAASSIMTV